MNNVEKANLKDEITDIKKDNIEEILLITKYCFTALIKSIIAFGTNHQITKDVINVYKEFFNIIIEEQKYLQFILKYIDILDVNEVNNYLFKLDDINEETIKYYYSVLDGIEDACDMKREWKAKRPSKNFNSLIETNEYSNELLGLILTMKEVKEFLNYEESFWQYIKDRTFIIDNNEVEDNSIYGVILKLDNDYLIDIKILIPKIINLETTLINIHELKHAYDLYKVLETKLTKSDKEYEEYAKNLEQDFKEKYLPKKYKKMI